MPFLKTAGASLISVSSQLSNFFPGANIKKTVDTKHVLAAQRHDLSMYVNWTGNWTLADRSYPSLTLDQSPHPPPACCSLAASAPSPLRSAATASRLTLLSPARWSSLPSVSHSDVNVQVSHFKSVNIIICKCKPANPIVCQNDNQMACFCTGATRLVKLTSAESYFPDKTPCECRPLIQISAEVTDSFLGSTSCMCTYRHWIRIVEL